MACAQSKNLIAPFKCFDVFSDGLNLPGKLTAQYLLAGFKKSVEQANDKSIFRFSKSAVRSIYSRRMYFYKDLVIFGSWFLYLFELKNFWRAIFCIYYRFHKNP